MGILVPTHTHTLRSQHHCVDQLFSRIALYLHQHDAYDRDGILAAIEYGFAGLHDELKPVVRNLDRAANISQWVEPYLADTPNVSQFRQFKLEMNDNKVTVSARSRCKDDPEFNPWRNLAGDDGPPYSQVQTVNGNK